MNVSATFSLVCLKLIVIRTDHLSIYSDQSFKNSLTDFIEYKIGSS